KETKVSSPIVAADNTVTFNLVAPDAKTVYLTGNWMVQKPQELPRVAMKKDASGLWSVKQDSLGSDLFLYNFIVDGVRINDPLNVYQVRDVGSVFNYFITNDGNADY